MAELRSPTPVREMPAFADLPAAGERIEAGRPILTFFARAGSPSACKDALRGIAEDLDRWLYLR
jgi:predicted ATP-grasp superfamily ATP-dependent carboligase